MKLDYKEFIGKIKSFQNTIQEKMTSESDDYLELIFSSVYRSVFIIHALKTKNIKLTIEVRATIPLDTPETPDQPYYNNQLQNMILLFTYLIELQENDFIIDVLPEGIWYATIELNKKTMDQNMFNLLNLNKNIL